MFFRFLIVGSLGFLVDAGCTHLFMVFGLSPFAARPPAVVVAMLFTWLLNRRFTFAVAQKRSLGELLKYGFVSLAAALLNVGLYSAFVMLGLPVIAAIALATALQACVSFLSYRRIVFTPRPTGAADDR